MITYTTNIDDLTSERVLGLLNRLVQVFGGSASDYVIQWGGDNPTFLSVMTGQTSDLNALGATAGAFFAALSPTVPDVTIPPLKQVLTTRYVAPPKPKTILDMRIN